MPERRVVVCPEVVGRPLPTVQTPRNTPDMLDV
jgi:hypothetical protein